MTEPKRSAKINMPLSFYSLFKITSVLLLASCQEPSAYTFPEPVKVKLAQKHKNYSTIFSDESEDWKKMGPQIVSINNQPTNVFDKRTYYRVKPGNLDIDVLALSRKYSYETISFYARPKHKYKFSFQNEQKEVIVTDITNEHQAEIIYTAKRIYPPLIDL